MPPVTAGLVSATPSFVAFWLRQGIVPDATFVEARPDEFVPLSKTVKPRLSV